MKMTTKKEYWEDTYRRCGHDFYKTGSEYLGEDYETAVVLVTESRENGYHARLRTVCVK